MRRGTAVSFAALLGVMALQVACSRPSPQPTGPDQLDRRQLAATPAAVHEGEGLAPGPSSRMQIFEVPNSSPLLLGIARSTGAKYTDEVESVVHTGVYSSRLMNLAGIERFSNLRFLNLPSHWISDLSQLSSLDRLESLYLNDNRIDNLAPLGSLKQLKTLHICHNHIDSVAPLSPLSQNITELVLSHNQLGDDDLLVVGNFSNLVSLAFEGNGVTDIRPLSRLTKLQRLYLSDNEISDVTPLAGMTTLEEILLTANKITTGVASLSRLKSLKQINLSKNASIPCRDLDTLERALGHRVVVRPETCVPTATP
jgi:Leucine-rich repeat (LRR) protein